MMGRAQPPVSRKELAASREGMGAILQGWHNALQQIEQFGIADAMSAIDYERTLRQKTESLSEDYDEWWKSSGLDTVEYDAYCAVLQSPQLTYEEIVARMTMAEDSQ